MTVSINALDNMGSVLWAGDSASSQTLSYTAYGSTTVRSGPSSLLPGFNGERLDPVGQTYPLGNGYRTYNPMLMRFNAPDNWSPFGAGGLNPYAYCEGDPINRSDPSGHLSESAWTGIGLGILGLFMTVVTGGIAIGAAGSVEAAFAAASATDIALGAAGTISDVAAIASGAASEAAPEASTVLGWISFGLGMAGSIASAANLGKSLHAKYRRRTGAGALAHDDEAQPLLAHHESDAPEPTALPPASPSTARRLAHDDPTSGLITMTDYGFTTDAALHERGGLHYLSGTERDACEVEPYGCGVQYKQQNNLPDGCYKYAISSDGGLYIRKRGPHSAFLHGTSVRSAGRLWACEGSIYKIDNDSGHYRPTLQQFIHAMSRAYDKGYIYSSTQLLYTQGNKEYQLLGYASDVLNKFRTLA